MENSEALGCETGRFYFAEMWGSRQSRNQSEEMASAIFLAA